MLRHIAPLLSVSLVLCSVGQPARGQPPTLPVNVVDVSYDPTTRTIQFGLKNTGTQEITAFTYSLSVTNRAGQSFTRGGGTDLQPLFSIRSLGTTNYTGCTSFNPGEVCREHWNAPPQWGDLDPGSLRVNATALILADCTTLGSDTRSIQGVLDSRKVHADAAKEVADAVAAVPRDRGFYEGLQAVAARSEAEKGTTGPRKQGTEFRARFAAEAVRAYQRSGTDGVDAFLAVHRAQAAGLSACSGKQEK